MFLLCMLCYSEKQLSRCFNSLQQISWVIGNTCCSCGFSSLLCSCRQQQHLFVIKVLHCSFLLPVAWTLACVLPETSPCWTNRHTYTYSIQNSDQTLLDNTCSQHQQQPSHPSVFPPLRVSRNIPCDRGL